MKQYIHTSTYNQENDFVIAAMTKAVELRDVIYQTQEAVFHWDKIRRAAEYFWRYLGSKQRSKIVQIYATCN